MLLGWNPTFPCMLASESRMIVHITVSTVDSRILANLVVKLEDMENPLDIDNLLLWRQLVCLGNWTCNGWIIRIEEVMTGIHRSNVEDPVLLDLDAWTDQQEQIGLFWKILS